MLTPADIAPMLAARSIARVEGERRRADARRQALRSTFRLFARELWPSYVPSAPVVNWMWFHDLICDEIQDLFVEADRRRAIVAEIGKLDLTPEEKGRRIRVAITGNDADEIKPLDLVIEVGPRSAKSSIVQRALVAWRWLTRPQEQFLTLACTPKIVERDGIYLRDLIESEAYKALKPAFDLREDQNAKSKFDTDKGGTRQGYGINTAYTGADADVRVVDDPHDVEDLMNRPPESIRNAAEEVVNTYRDKIQDRANNPIFVITLLIMQRVAQNDLANYMLEHGARSVCLPTLFEADHPRKHPKDPRREDGEPLDPVRKPRQEMERRRGESPRWFKAKEQQRPEPGADGGLFQAEYFLKLYTDDPEDLARRLPEVVISADLTFKGTEGTDFVSLQVWGKDGTKKYLLDRVHGRMSYIQAKAAFKALCLRYPTAHLKLVEDKANGPALISDLQSEIPGLVAFNPGARSKYERASVGSLPAFAAGDVWLPARAPWLQDYVGEHTAFPLGANDDDVDATSQVMLWWLEHAQVFASTLAGPWWSQEEDE